MRHSLKSPWSGMQRVRVAAFAAAFVLAACHGSNLGDKQPRPQGTPQAGAAATGDQGLKLPPGAVEVQPLNTGAAAAPPAAASGAGENPQAVKVGLLLPLSGNSAPLGRALLNSAELAVFETAGKNFALLPRDTEGSPEGAARAARAVLDDGAKLILGPLFAEEVLAVAPLARSAGVNVIAFSTDERVAGEGVFLMGFLPRTQVKRIVVYAHAQGINRFAAVVPDTPYGQAIASLLRDTVGEAGASIAGIESYNPAANNAAEVVRRLANYDSRHAALLAQRKQLEGKTDEVSRQALQRLQTQDTVGDVDFDAVMLPEGGERLLALAPLLPYYDIDPSRVRLLGTGLWDDPRVRKEPALLGGWYVAPDPNLRGDYDQRYAKLYDAPTPPRIATLGYDAAALAAALAKSGGEAGFSAQALTNPNGFSGVDGIFRFNEDGRNERGLAVLEVHGDAPTVMSPAPVSFATE
ncbi:MAG TPA: penicillin-binding protein activator [Alphaproteobacteria bacterium]|nr:penicillin-binding protein activator [Alphaproteobacteria bacterium]